MIIIRQTPIYAVKLQIQFQKQGVNIIQACLGIVMHLMTSLSEKPILILLINRFRSVT